MYRLHTLCGQLARWAVTQSGVLDLYGGNQFAVNAGSPDQDDADHREGLRTVFVGSTGELDPWDKKILPEMGMVDGTMEGTGVPGVQFWASLDYRGAVPLVPAAPQVYYRTRDGRTLDLEHSLPMDTDLGALTWGSRPAVAADR